MPTPTVYNPTAIGGRSNRQEYNDWYPSGTDTEIFFGNVNIPFIVNLSWDAVEQKAPMYGYASKHYDAVAAGTRIVQGVFAIAFRDINAITDILHLVSKSGISNTYEELLRQRREKRAKDAASYSGQEYGITRRPLSYAELLDGARNGDRPEMFNTISTSLKDSIWGNKAGMLSPSVFDHDIKGRSIGSGFDIMITYGNPDGPPEGFTTKSVEDCHISGTRQQLGPTGEPILEIYSFFGKSMDPHAVYVATERAKKEETPAPVPELSIQSESSDNVRTDTTFFPPSAGYPYGYIVISIPSGLFDSGWRFVKIRPQILLADGVISGDGLFIYEELGADDFESFIFINSSAMEAPYAQNGIRATIRVELGKYSPSTSAVSGNEFDNYGTPQDIKTINIGPFDVPIRSSAETGTT